MMNNGNGIPDGANAALILFTELNLKLIFKKIQQFFLFGLGNTKIFQVFPAPEASGIYKKMVSQNTGKAVI
jgi:hypothetical protein